MAWLGVLSGQDKANPKQRLSDLSGLERYLDSKWPAHPGISQVYLESRVRPGRQAHQPLGL